MGRAYDSRRGAVLPSHPPEFLAFGEGHPLPVVAARDGAFDRDFAGHSPNITATDQVGGLGGRTEWSASSTFASKAIRPSTVIGESGTPARGQTHPSGMAGNSPVYSHRLEMSPSCSWAGGWKTRLQNPWQKVILQVFQPEAQRMTLYGYARVSVREPEDKNLDLQVERLVRARLCHGQHPGRGGQRGQG